MRSSDQSPGFKVRLAGISDETNVEEACRLFLSPGDVNTPRFLKSPGTCLMLGEIDDRIVGWAYGQEIFHPDGERTMLLYSLDVAEDARQHGLGRELVRSLVEEARSRGCTELWVLADEDNDAALATYASAGGARNSIPSVMFSWRLAPGRHRG